jgi:16S rRNA (guanine966-N2)-methyltransferase
VLGDLVTDADVLDLYAGTGAVGFEALSRGARSVVFVERNAVTARIVHANRLALAASESQARVLVRPALRAIVELARRQEVYRLAWADPPFELWQEGLEALALAFELGVLATDATACLECPERAVVEPPEPLRIERDLRGGASRLVLLVAR